MCFFFHSGKPVHLNGAGSFAELDVFRDKSKFAVSMNIRPDTKDGMILYGDDKKSPDFVSIGLKNGFVEVRYELSYCLQKHLILCCT